MAEENQETQDLEDIFLQRREKEKRARVEMDIIEKKLDGWRKFAEEYGGA